jgi:hypothetical protein
VAVIVLPSSSGEPEDAEMKQVVEEVSVVPLPS